MNETLQIILISFCYFGSLLIPAAYLLFTLGKGIARKGMIIGAGLQFFWSLAVWALVYYSWRAGNRDYYYAWALLLPVNIVSAIYYVAFLIWKYTRRTS